MYQVSASSDQTPWAVSHQTQPSTFMNKSSYRCHIEADIPHSLYLLCCFTSGMTCSCHMGQLQPDAIWLWCKVRHLLDFLLLEPGGSKFLHSQKNCKFISWFMHKCKGLSVLFGYKIGRCSQEETVRSLTHYQMDYFSVEVTFSLCTPVLSDFQAPNFTLVSLQTSSTRLWLKPHPPINELAIVMALSRSSKLGKKLHCREWESKVRQLFLSPGTRKYVLAGCVQGVLPCKSGMLRSHSFLPTRTSTVSKWAY